MAETERSAHPAGFAGRISEIAARAEKIKTAPMLSKAALAQDAVADILEVLADMGAALDALEGGQQ